MTEPRRPFNPDLIKTPPAAPQPPPRGPLTVSQVSALVRRAIQTAIPATVHVVGEISNFKRHGSGHLYFTLKDEHSEIACVMWRSDATRMKFDPHDGLEVIASGTVDVFERAGRYQLYTRKLEPKGLGALELAFRKLYEKLEKEGLFDPAHKKPLPEYPATIAIVTSPSGAALADMIRALERRYPCVRVLLYPVRVQGEEAAPEIAAAIRNLNDNVERLGGVDLMIAARGGGSLEDLWAFNEEVVARAIYASKIPVVSAVGHEVDVTIADLVADVRAATPSAAAEFTVPDAEEVLAGVAAIAHRVGRAIKTRVEIAVARLAPMEAQPLLRRPKELIRRREQVLDELTLRMVRDLTTRIRAVRRIVDTTEASLRRIAPHTYLARTSSHLRDASHRLQWVLLTRLRNAERRVDRLARVVPPAIQHRLDLATMRTTAAESLLTAVGHRSVLARGFSITRLKKGRRILRSTRDLTDRQRLITQLADGEVESETVNVHQMELFE